MRDTRKEALEKIRRYADENGKENAYDILLEEVLWDVLTSPVEDIWVYWFDEEVLENRDALSLNQQRNDIWHSLQDRYTYNDSIPKDALFDILISEVLPNELETEDLDIVAEIIWEWSCD